MPCFHPIDAWQPKYSSGSKRPLKFSLPRRLDDYSYIQVPCGQCIGCRLERSRQWAMRCVHESMMHDENSFITLTFDDENLPSDRSIKKKHVSDFMKALRHKINYLDELEYLDLQTKTTIPLPALKYRQVKFFSCGEYGEHCSSCGHSRFDHTYKRVDCSEFIPSLGRPHYHLCLFGYQFPDLKLYTERDGVRLFTSEILDNIWKKGMTTVGELTFETAAYTARYITKKLTGDVAQEHYELVLDSGEIVQREPEFALMSRNPGIAASWYKKYKGDLDKDTFVMRGVKMRPAKFYDYLLEKEVLGDRELATRKLKRKENAIKHADNNTPSRLAVREKILLKRLTKLNRGLENGT